MRNDRIIPGTILVMIGTIFLLHNFHVIHFHWGNLFHLWPIFLVIAGVNLVFANNKSAWATILKVSVVVAGFALLIFGNYGDRYRWWPHYTYHYDSNDDNNDDDDDDSKSGLVKVEGSSVFSEPFNVNARIAKLNIDGGATTYIINDTTNQLFSASTTEFYGKYQYNHQQTDSVATIDFKLKNNKGEFHWSDDDSKETKSNEANIKLNINPIWDIKVETGASKVDFDLTKYKLRSLTFKGGAASFTAKIGQPLTATHIEVSTGVSGVEINIPQNAACRIQTDTGLSSTSFDGFTKKDNGNYETAGFDAAKNKLYIHITGGVSDFKVHKY